jgi:hypothetical protein
MVAEHKPGHSIRFGPQPPAVWKPGVPLYGKIHIFLLVDCCSMAMIIAYFLFQNQKK